MEVIDNREDLFDKIITIDAGNIFVGSTKSEEMDSVISTLKDNKDKDAIEGVLSTLKQVPFASIKKVSANLSNDMVYIHHQGKDKSMLSVSCKDSAMARGVVESLAKNLETLTLQEKQLSPFSAILKPLGTTAIISLFISGAYMIADAGAEEAMEASSGRRSFLKKIVWYIASTLGQTGVIILGGAILSCCAYWIFKSFKNPPLMLILK